MRGTRLSKGRGHEARVIQKFPRNMTGFIARGKKGRMMKGCERLSGKTTAIEYQSLEYKRHERRNGLFQMWKLFTASCSPIMIINIY